MILDVVLEHYYGAHLSRTSQTLGQVGKVSAPSTIVVYNKQEYIISV
jgi:hypothetical protein